MRFLGLTILLSFFYFLTSAQVVKADLEGTSFYCGYFDNDSSEMLLASEPSDEPVEIIGNIVSQIGLKKNFEIRSANISNAAAVVIKGKRFILYNPAFMQRINTASRTDWAGISILAHEIGHHLNGHTLTGEGSRPDLELEADEFSGFILNKMGASLAEAQSAMQVAASMKASHTHPAKKDRLEAIATGWNNAAGVSPKENIAKKENVIKPSTPEKPVVSQTPIEEKYIAYDVYFPADHSRKYYVTIRNNLVVVEGDKLYIIGRLAQSNYKKYPYMFYDKEYNYLYINSKGSIYNRAGNFIGKMSPHKKA